MCGLSCHAAKVSPVGRDEHNVPQETSGYDVCLDTHGSQEYEFPIRRFSPRSEGSRTNARNEEKLAYQTEHPIRILRGEQRHGHDPKYGWRRQKYQQECDGSSQLGHLLNLTSCCAAARTIPANGTALPARPHQLKVRFTQLPSCCLNKASNARSARIP